MFVQEERWKREEALVSRVESHWLTFHMTQGNVIEHKKHTHIKVTWQKSHVLLFLLRRAAESSGSMLSFYLLHIFQKASGTELQLIERTLS